MRVFLIMISIITKARDNRFGESQWLGAAASGKIGRRRQTIGRRFAIAGDGASVELYQIRYFLALCETLNFARAAERCGVSSPSLTRAVQKLEQELGGLLIRRERRLTHLTELGRLVRPMLGEVLAQAEGTKTAANRFLSNREKPLRVGIMPSVGPLYLAPFLARFGALHPGIELAFAEGEAARLEELLLGGDLDVAVAAGLGPTNR